MSIHELSSNTHRMTDPCGEVCDATTHRDPFRPFVLMQCDKNEVDDTRVWRFTDQARDILAAMPEKRSRSVGIAGPMRMGKSYLMNRFGLEQRGFRSWWTRDKLHPAGCGPGFLPRTTRKPLRSFTPTPCTRKGWLTPTPTAATPHPMHNFPCHGDAAVVSSSVQLHPAPSKKKKSPSLPSLAQKCRSTCSFVLNAKAGVATAVDAKVFKDVFPRLTFLSRDFHLDLPPDCPNLQVYLTECSSRVLFPRRPTR